METQEEDREMKLLRDHCMILSEHFDAVQVFASRHISNEKGTIQYNTGSGNFFARFGQVTLWIEEQTLTNSEDED